MAKYKVVELHQRRRLEETVEQLEKGSPPPTSATPPEPKDLFEGRASLPGGDASADYPDAFRDHGRYGSHPSHDDYSDEGLA